MAEALVSIERPLLEARPVQYELGSASTVLAVKAKLEPEVPVAQLQGGTRVSTAHHRVLQDEAAFPE